MSEIIVEVREIHIQKVKVEANTNEEAIRKAANGEGEEIGDSEYYRTLDPCTWTIEKSY